MKTKQTTINEIITYLNSGHCPYAIIDDALLINADSIKLLRQFPANSIDACVSDGPYGIGIMGKEWDNFKSKSLSPENRHLSMHAGPYKKSMKEALCFQEWCYMGATELYRVLKPGAYILMFCSPRMYHRLVCGIEDAGFQVKDTLMWLFGEGFPKSKSISAAISDIQNAKQWEGFGTALKPAHELILLAQKPREGTYANNVLKYGVGGLNIDACRIGDKGGTQAVVLSKQNKNRRLLGGGISNEVQVKPISKGRFPSNVIIDDYVAEQLKEKSRYFYCPKISEKERHAGCEHLHFKNSTTKGGSRTYEDYCGNCGKKFIGSENTRCHCPKGDKVTMRPEKSGNIHPTVKPVSLMQYLIEMIVPPQAICLDIFAGSGSTGIACNQLGMGRQFVGIDIEKDYFEIAKARLSYWSKKKKSA